MIVDNKDGTLTFKRPAWSVKWGYGPARICENCKHYDEGQCVNEYVMRHLNAEGFFPDPEFGCLKWEVK